MGKSTWRALASGAALSATGWAHAAQAQVGDSAVGSDVTAVSQPGDQSSGRSSASQTAAVDPGEIVVTAQRRAERLQDVPLSISVFNQQAIEQQGIQSIDDYASRAAGVRLQRDGTQASFAIRGISSTTGADTTSATAGIYVDEYPIYDTWFRFSSPDLRIFDVARIEVLRGPQGTLYGATSLAGSIRILTNRPDLNNVDVRFEGTLSTTDGASDVNYAANGMVNIPLIEGRLAARVVAYSRADQGYIDNVRRGESEVNDQRSYGGRLYLSAQPNDTLNLLASITYQHDEQDDQSASFYFPTTTRTTEQWNSAVPTRIRSDLLIASLTANQELGGGNLYLNATYGENRARNIFDGTPYSTLFGAPVATEVNQPSDSTTRILEARYTSGTTGPIRFTLGAYYNARSRDFQQVAFQPALIPLFGTSRVYQVVAEQTATEYAGYGEGTWAFAQGWEATVGLRVFSNTYHFESDVSGLLNSFATPLVSSVTDVDNNQSGYTPRFSLSFRPVQNINLYATVSKGYRFGLTNYNSGATAGTPLTYDPDSLWNYELGAKTVLLDGRLTLNSVLYMSTGPTSS